MTEMRDAVRRVIAETFSLPPSALPDDATADDVDGWDSLTHTVLMVRLQNAFSVTVPESVASEADTVGDLIAAVTGLVRARP